MRLPLDFAELLSYPSILSVCIRTECKEKQLHKQRSL